MPRNGRTGIGPVIEKSVPGNPEPLFRHEFLRIFAVSRKTVQKISAAFPVKLRQHFERNIISAKTSILVAAVYQRRDIKLQGKLQKTGKNFLLDSASGRIIVEIKPDLTDRHEFAMRGKDFEVLKISGHAFRFMGMHPCGEINRFILRCERSGTFRLLEVSGTENQPGNGFRCGFPAVFPHIRNIITRMKVGIYEKHTSQTCLLHDPRTGKTALRQLLHGTGKLPRHIHNHYCHAKLVIRKINITDNVLLTFPK